MSDTNRVGNEAPRKPSIVIERLREMRDIAWKFGRCHEAFNRLEDMAESALLDFGVSDQPYPNPRPLGWWKLRAVRQHPEPALCEFIRSDGETCRRPLNHTWHKWEPKDKTLLNHPFEHPEPVKGGGE